ncbi:DUF6522 family protein [Plastorhodobacter daqingensis]|uniref:DUF6522 family protein n=1 Tax=Plastorhodobacter daqingensis TaxID=1387281 RepID=A0ABW2UK34_9RHOB
MSGVTREGEGFVVEAALLAEGLGLQADEVPELMRSGQISSRCEKGTGEHEGRWRLSFRLGGRTLRLTVDGAGRILARARIGGVNRGSAG